jgi:hypothetical protein
MQTEFILAGAVTGFLVLFWFTPAGIPTLKRFGAGQMSPDLRLHYGAEETYRLLDLYGPRGVAHWRRMLWLDMIFPAAYAALFATLAMDWSNWVGAGPTWRLLAVSFPILAAASDYVENILLLGVLAALPRRTPARVAIASAFTTIKHLSGFATLTIPLLHWTASALGWLA